MARAVRRAPAKGNPAPTHRNQKAFRRPPSRGRALPTARPRVPEAARAQAFEAAHQAARQTAWGRPGAVLATVGGVRVWGEALATGRPHWQLLTDGLWRRGYELSLRVVRARDEVAPPAWALALLDRQVRRALGEDAAPPDATWSLEEAAPMTPGSDLAALTLAPETTPGALETPHGRAPVWQLVPLTRDEARLVREWCPSGLVELLRTVDPLLVANAERASLLQSPRARLAIEQRVSREGSSLKAMHAKVSTLTRAKAEATWRLSADAVDTVIALLRGRTAHQRAFVVHGNGAGVEVRPGDAPAVDVGPEGAVLKLSQAASRQLRAQLRARPGRYTIESLPGFAVEVV